MSQKELDRTRILDKLQSKRISQVQAASQLGLTTRHIRRLLKQLQREGSESAE